MNMKDFQILFTYKDMYKSNNMSIVINKSISYSWNQFQSKKHFALLLKSHIELTYKYFFISKTNDSIYMYTMYIIYVKYIPTQIIHVQINKYFCIDRKRTFYNFKNIFVHRFICFFTVWCINIQEFNMYNLYSTKVDRLKVNKTIKILNILGSSA